MNESVQAPRLHGQTYMKYYLLAIEREIFISKMKSPTGIFHRIQIASEDDGTDTKFVDVKLKNLNAFLLEWI